MRILSQKGSVVVVIIVSILRGVVFLLLPPDLRAHIFLWVLPILHKALRSLMYLLGSQQMLPGLSIALGCYFPKRRPPWFILGKHSFSIYLTSAHDVLTLYWFGAGVSNLRTFAKLGNWNMLEQELLKSFFETKREGMVYALAAGYLEMMVSNRERCKEKAKGISHSHIISWLHRPDVRGMEPSARSRSIV